jgi:hypothetical protein
VQPLDRVIAAAYEIKGGALYPRWYSLSNFGMGSPSPNFYAPAVALTAAYLYAAGVP